MDIKLWVYKYIYYKINRNIDFIYNINVIK